MISVDELLGPALSAILYQQKEAGSWVVGEVDTRNLTAGQSELASAGSTGERLTIRGGLNDEEVSGAVATLDSVVKLITQASTLGLEHVHELNEVGIGGSLSCACCLSQECSRRGLLRRLVGTRRDLICLSASVLPVRTVHNTSTQVGSGGLVTVLQRPVPKEGDVQGLLAMIMDIQVRAWCQGLLRVRGCKSGVLEPGT